jgi:hypothetical protein
MSVNPKTARERAELNLVVKALAAKDRQRAVDLLASFDGAMNTVELKSEHVEACTAAFIKAVTELENRS